PHCALLGNFTTRQDWSFENATGRRHGCVRAARTAWAVNGRSKPSTGGQAMSLLTPRRTAAGGPQPGGGSSPTPGTTIYPMPESRVTPITSASNQAVSTIDLEIYQMTDPVATRALLAAAKRGVKVRAMLEPHTVGSNSYQAVSANLSKNGVTVKPTPPDFDT